MLLKQQEDINKIRKSSQAYKDKLRQLMRGHQDVSLSSVSPVSAATSGSSNSPSIDTAKNSISEPPVRHCVLQHKLPQNTIFFTGGDSFYIHSIIYPQKC